MDNQQVLISFLSPKTDVCEHIYLNNVSVPVPVPAAPKPDEGVVHKGTATPLIVDPFCNTRCCSSAGGAFRVVGDSSKIEKARTNRAQTGHAKLVPSPP